jgi:hypothetical protein
LRPVRRLLRRYSVIIAPLMSLMLVGGLKAKATHKGNTPTLSTEASMEHTPWSYREGNRMVALPRPVYAAVQRALANILAGREAPLEEAVEAINWEYGTHLRLVQVMEPLADYVHLLIRQLPSIPAPVEAMLAARTEQLREHIVKEQHKLHQLQQAEVEQNGTVTRELADLRQTRQQYKALEPQAKALRKRFTSLLRTEHLIQQRLAELEQADQAIQQPLEAIARRERAAQSPA